MLQTLRDGMMALEADRVDGTGYYALVPAAGSGMRMGSAQPKQYLEIAGKSMIAWSVQALLACSRLDRVTVVLAPGDIWWSEAEWAHDIASGRLQVLRCGGDTRAQSVTNGLTAMQLPDDAWVLVHDAARPCLEQDLIDRLIDTVGADAVGGLLAIPVADTLKRIGSGQRVSATVPREGLWLAQTPQMFRSGLLLRALKARDGARMTDEASAVEALGLSPLLVESRAGNFKVTWPDDLVLARLRLAAAGKSKEGT